VKDSNGTVVGPYFYGLGIGEAVATKTASGTLIFGLGYSSTSPSGVPQLTFQAGGSSQTAIYYATSKCSGTPYYNANASGNFPRIAGVQMTDGTNYYADPPLNAATVNLTAMSYRNAVPNFSCTTSVNIPGTFAPMGTGTPLSTPGFAPPFTIQLNQADAF
jgi:hypothetical protein